MDTVASTKLSELLKPTSAGEPVNVHVVRPVAAPAPDFSAMKRLIEGDKKTQKAHPQIKHADAG